MQVDGKNNLQNNRLAISLHKIDNNIKMYGLYGNSMWRLFATDPVDSMHKLFINKQQSLNRKSVDKLLKQKISQHIQLSQINKSLLEIDVYKYYNNGNNYNKHQIQKATDIWRHMKNWNNLDRKI